MNKSIEKKLLHFFTGGSIYEDFAAARKRKTSKLRRLIRACFYVHFAAAVICIALAAVLKAGTAAIVAVALCEVLLLGLAFMAVGDMTLIKTLLCCGDTAFAAAMFVTGALLSESADRTPFFSIGAVSVAVTLCAFGAYYAAMCREFLDNFSPLAIKKEHYTLLSRLAKDNDAKALEEDADELYEELSEDSSADAPELYELDINRDFELKPIPPPPPPKTEIQVLADKLKEILCAPKNDTVDDAMPKPQPEIGSDAPVIPEASETSNNI